VNPKAGITFASGLRAILRQDPDIIMVGEIRDAETVEIAIRAAITGHLVLSTIHTNDAVSSIFRLVDMGVPGYMVAASLVGIISQRLVRKICPACKHPYEPTAAELGLAGLTPKQVEGKTFYKGFGCAECNQTGYKGRMAVHEILIISPEFRDLIHKGAPLNELRKHAMEHDGMVPLRTSALQVLWNGTTSLEELIAITHGT
jgi:type IV pilus assembly protein PilB